MAIMSRILRLWKADMHGVMDQLEDKALLLKQYLREMESSLQQKQNRLNRIRQTCEQIRNDMSIRVSEQDKVKKDIELAVSKEKDDIARMLIRKRMALEADGERLMRQLHQLEEEAVQLAKTLGEQQSQYERLKVKAAAYCRRAEQGALDGMAPLWSDPAAAHPVTEEEVELELLRCKEILSQGGAV